MELLLHASKYVFINELSIYRTFVGKVLRPETEDDYKMRGLYASITDKKAGKLRDMITDNITQWGTLHTQAATETIDEQQSKIEYLAKLIVETTPGKMAEVTALLDNSSEDTTESDAIITEIMKGVKEESDQPSVVRL
jgi:outer membrane scaffolding protein for murein synthesis (MipA/OmpV family)